MRKTFTYDGVRYSVQRKTEAELNAAIAEKKLLLKENKKREANILFREYASRWLDVYKAPYVGNATMQMYQSAIKTISGYVGNKRLKDITTTDLQGVIKNLYGNCGKSKMDKVIMTMRQIYRQAVADRLVAFDPTAALQRPKMRERKLRALTKCEEMYIVDFCKKSKYGTWVLSMLYLGLRPSETAILRVSDIQNGYVHVRGTKSPKADRYIPLPEALTFDLRGLKPRDHIFTTRYGTRLDRQSMKRWWGYFKRELDLSLGAETYRNKITKSYIKDLTPYTLRHTFGTRAQQAGIPIDVLADLMGHEKIETTRKYYISDNMDSKEREREKLNKMWKTPDI